MPVLIDTTSPGGYCCGMAHARGKRTYPDDWFTNEQIRELNAHPLITARRKAIKKVAPKPQPQDAE